MLNKNPILGAQQLLHTPIISLMIILVMGFALFLTTIFYLLWNSQDTIHNRWNESAEISLYLKKNTSPNVAAELTEKLRHYPLIAKVEIIQPEEGMKTFLETIALKMLLPSFKENPLPTVIIIYPKIKLLSKNTIVEFIQILKKQPEVETIKADTDWLERSHNWLNLWDNLAWIFAFILSINAILVVGGLSYAATQILISKNKGHKDILPYQFACYGLIGSGLALLWARIIAITLQDQEILVQSLSFGFGFLLICGSLVLSFFGSKAAATNNH